MDVVSASMLQWHYYLGRNRLILLKRLLASTSIITQPDPMLAVREITATAYAHTWARFVLFLLRLRSQTAASLWRFTWITTIGACVDAVAAASIAERPTAIFALTRAVVRQRIPSDPYESPVILFLGGLGWRARKGRWQTADEHGPILAQLLYVFRIFVLYDITSQGDPSETFDVHLHARPVLAQWLHDDSVTVFAELLSQKAYASARGREQYSKPSIHWPRRTAEVIEYQASFGRHTATIELSRLRI